MKLYVQKGFLEIMGILQRLTSQRGRVAYWSPIAVLLLIGLLNVVPFAGMDFTVEQLDEVEDEYSMTAEFYPDNYVMTRPFTEDYDESGVFDGEENEKLPYKNQGSYYEDIGYIGNELSMRLATMTTITLLMVIVGLSCRNDRLNANSFLNGRTLTGIGLAVIALYSILMASTIVQDFADLQNEEYEEAFEEAESEQNEGAWGEIVSESEDENRVSTLSWSPRGMFWISLLLVIVSGAGAFSNLSYLKKAEEAEDQPSWPKGEHPSWFNKDWTNAAFGALVLAAMVALFAPWYQVDQEWFVSENNDQSDFSNSTHELGWSMNPFYVTFTNDTGLFEDDDGEKTTETSGYSERYELSETAPVFTGLRAPLVCMLLLTIGWLAFQSSKKTLDRFGGNKEHWSLILISMVMAIVLLRNLSSFEKDMKRTLDDDLEQFSPMLNFTFVHDDVDDAFSGKSFSQSVDSNWFEEEYTITRASMEWGPSWGYYALQIIPWLFISGICIRFGPEIVQTLNRKESFTAPSFDREVWTARPVVALLVSSLLVTVVGIGPGQLVENLTSSSPKELYQWELELDYESHTDEGSNVLSNQETLILSYNTADLGLSNTYSVYFDLSCDEGDQGASTDAADEITWEISAPNGVDTEEMLLTGSISCASNNARQSLSSELVYPDDEAYAASEQEYISLFEIINPLDGVWSITLTATINEGFDPFSSDSDLLAVYGIYIDSIENIRAEKVE